MPGETSNIKTMAERVAKEILGRFGWSLTGPCDENFPCIKIDDHKRKKHAYHPVDAVFQYDDPYSDARQYFLTDFKSYAKDSISPDSVRKALVSLSTAVDCANVSHTWQDRYVNNEVGWEVHGLLFIYNHDGDFADDFMKYLIGTTNKALILPAHSRLYVIGPERINYLVNLLNDLDVQRGRGNFPMGQDIQVSYPDLVTARPAKTICATGRAELLLGPWQVLPYDNYCNGVHKKGSFIYYASKGESPQEFEFLFDYAFKSQLVQPDAVISIRMPNAHDNATQHFEGAKDNFFRHFRAFPEVRKRLDQFELCRIDTVKQGFSTVPIGMEARNG